MNEIDRDALERALVACRAQDAGRAKQIDSMPLDEPWERAARFAAYSAQMDSLGLMPWQSPPCQAGLNDLNQPLGDARGRRKAPSCSSTCSTPICRHTSPIRWLRLPRPSGVRRRSDPKSRT
jgi:hypothetical protein